MNQRDPELCAQALQQLLSLLQTVPPEGMIQEPKVVIQRMFELLRKLRAEGNSTVSSTATACLVALAVARGDPEILFSTAKSLLCDVKTNIPFNQLSSELNPLPKNFQSMALTVNRNLHYSNFDFFSIPLMDHEEVVSFDLNLPRDLSEFSEPSTSDFSPKSCLVSDGAYLYILTYCGFFKVGSGLSETQGSRVLAVNELLKFREGSTLFICQDSLYLRRKHSSRLWVIDKESLREIGEIMLHASLTEGILFSDGRNFFQGNLDEQWNFVVIFNILIIDQKNKQSNRLVEFSYAVFGEGSDFQEKLISTIPTKIQSLSIDLQFSNDTGFLLTRTGEVYYAGRASLFSLTDTGLVWTELNAPEPIVQMHVDSFANCLLMRSGSGHLWSVGSLIGLMENQLPHGQNHSKRFRKIRIPHKRKCSSISGIHGAMAYVTENGKCYLFGRHIVSSNNDSGQLTGFEGFSIASIGIGKTHLVAISKSGLVYTCGLNNLNQCGRDEPNLIHALRQPEALPKISESPQKNISPTGYCFPGEHLFIKDVASICLRCGKCSGKNEKCPTNTVTGGLKKVNLQKGMLCVCESSDCGNYHTILLCADRSVYTFGSNCHGQLGTGDTEKKSGAVKLDLPQDVQVVQAVAGANHCVLRTSDGRILTFGAYKNGQLKRSPPKEEDLQKGENTKKKWFATPTIVEGFGQEYGRIVSWVGTKGDNTLIQVQKQTFSRNILADSRVTANRDYMIIMPPAKDSGADYVIVKRRTGEISQFFMEEFFSKISFSLDPDYPILWVFDDETLKISGFSEARKTDFYSKESSTDSEFSKYEEPTILKKNKKFLNIPELQIPTEIDPEFSDPQISIFILTTMYSMSVLGASGEEFYFQKNRVQENPKKNKSFKKYSESNFNEGYCIVNRFELFGGGWGYSVHSMEAVQFKVSKEIFISGVGLFGGRGEYSAKIKLLKVVGGELEDHCVELLAESDEVVYECAPRETAVIQLNKNVLVGAEEWYVLVAQIQGPSSDCGASGKSTIKAAGDVEFTFRNSLLSNNGTDVEVGQIPEIYYTLKNVEDFEDVRDLPENSLQEKPPLISVKTLFQITPETISDLFCIFDWATKGSFSSKDYGTPKDYGSPQHYCNGNDYGRGKDYCNEEEATWKQERAAFIAVISLKMLRLYISLLFSSQNPETKEESESPRKSVKSGLGQFDEFTNLIIDFSNILKNIFSFADERFFLQDRIGAFVMEETVEAYVTSAELLLPSASVARKKISQGISREKRNWSLLALLKACEKLEPIALEILVPEKNQAENELENPMGTLGEKLSRYFLPTGNGSNELTGSGIIRFLFDLGFAVSEHGNEDVLFFGLKKAAQNLICLFAKVLVSSNLKIESGPPLHATDNRFRRFNSHLNWETGNGAHDAISFKVDSKGVTIHGVGVFVGQAASGDFSYELETFLNTGDLANECWSLVGQQTGYLKDSSIGVPQNPPNSNQKLVTGIKLTKPMKLEPDVTYCVRIHLSSGKSFYGENGQATVKLLNNIKLNFMPCSLSKNGTTLIRGQIPYLIYCIDETENKKKESFLKKEKSKEDFWKVDDERQNLFIEIMRLLTQKFSYLIASENIDLEEKSLCSQLIAYATVFLEGNPDLAFHLISSFDEIIPLLSSSNSDEIKKNNKFFSSTESREMKMSEVSARDSTVTQALVESPHPYKSGFIYSETLVFDPQTEFMCLRFHEDCQTANSEDVLWIYSSQTSNPDFFYPVGKFFGTKNWPENQIVIPGFKLWFIFESSLPSEIQNSSKMYGFRITVDGFSSKKNSIINEMKEPSHSLLEQEFVWLCSHALRQFVQIPKSSKKLKKIEKNEREIFDLIQRHGSLLKKGLNFEEIPTVKDLIYKKWPGMGVSQERCFLDDFISGSSSTAPGRLARAFSFCQSFLDLTLSTVEIEATEITVGKSVKLILIQKDQFNKEAKCMNITVDITISSADDVMTKNFKELDVQSRDIFDSNSLTSEDQGRQREGFHTLRQLQLKEKFKDIYLNKARYKAISMMPAFSNFSFEELRLSFQETSFIKEELKLSFQNNLGNFAVEWKPKRSGRFRIDCRIDGFKLLSSTFIEVADTPVVTPTISLTSNVLLSPRNQERRKVLLESSSGTKMKFAKLDSLSSFAAVRIRIHPTLTSPVVGKIERGCTLTWSEMIKNSEGTWLKLTDEAKILFCDKQQISQNAWCLQYHKDFETTLLIIDEPDLMSPQKSSAHRILPQIPKSPKRKLPKPPKLESELNEEGEVLTVRRQMNEEGEGSSNRRRKDKEDVVSPSVGRQLNEDISIPSIEKTLDEDTEVPSVRRQINEDIELSSTRKQFNEDVDSASIKKLSMNFDSSSFLSSQNVVNEALGPRLMDTCRSVFAALVWHEFLVSDLITCGNHLKSSPDLEQFFEDPDNPALPSCFSSLLKLYKSTIQSILEVVEQHLILPSPPFMKELRSRQQFPPPEELCELCHQLHPKPITVHMREKHPGCGKPSGGHGYNSIGNYTTGWTGFCGNGGTSNAVWYLLCPSCRAGYLSKYVNDRASSSDDHNDWPEFRQKAANKQFSAETILKQNAMFLLDLRPTENREKMPKPMTRRRRIIFDNYPLASESSQGDQKLAPEAMVIETDDANNSGFSPLHYISHQSDPGAGNEVIKSMDLFSLSASANLFRKPNNQLYYQPQKLATLNGLNELLRHPVLVFCVESHDLNSIKKNVKSAISRSVKFSYAFRVWHWLLKLVTSETTVSDIVWNYLTAMSSYSPYNHWLNSDLKLATKLKLLPHPWRLCFLAGPEVNSFMIKELHGLLGTLAVIVQSNGVDMSLKCLCFKAWTFQLTIHEQNLLITLCNILSAVGTVLSEASGENSSFLDESSLSILTGFVPVMSSFNAQGHSAIQKTMKKVSSSNLDCCNQFVLKKHENLSNFLQIEASSRSQLVHCLVDGNLETFWESGEEDKSRFRRLEVVWDDVNYRIDLLTIFVDNIRDPNFKVNQIVVRNLKMNVIMNLDIDWNFVGWLKVVVSGLDGVHITLKGSDNGCRLRQIVAFGQKTSTTTPEEVKQDRGIRPSLSHQIFFSTAQMDAFTLFQAIAAQAFSDELAEEKNGTLRQQVIDLLFNRVQLQPLQSYVCFQMVSAVEREIISLRDRSKKNYGYVCGLMVMLVKICESRKGLEVFSLKNGLLIILSELLFFAPSVVQNQVIETVSVLLKHFKPQEISVFVQNLLAGISKAVSLQVKDKTTRKVSSQKIGSQTSEVPPNWRLDRPMTSEVAQKIIKFINKITSSDFGEPWAIATKTELANQIMNLSQILTLASTSSSELTEPTLTEAVSKTTSSLKTSQFWLTVSALALINDPKWLEHSPTFKLLKAKKSKEPDSFCENHDNGHTLAHFRCEICQSNLCRDCFTILHLNKKKKSHNARLIGCSTLCPKVDVHEGCTRLRINNLLVLFNTSKLSGMVEVSADIGGPSNVTQSSSFSNLNNCHSGKCRFCSNKLSTDETLLGICSHVDCIQLASEACNKILSCGHFCGGIKDEENCLPCFICEKSESKQDTDDLCVICFVDRLGGAPCIKLSCGHLFHFKCVKTVLEKRWAGPRILFRFMHCPLCNALIEHESLEELLTPLKKLHQDVSEKAKMRLEYDGFPKTEIQDPETFAMEKYVYVLCSKCGKAYFGGESSCQEALESSTDYNPEDLLCGACSDVAGAEVCGRHGAEYLEYKCRFCCSVAVYFCFGSTHFCAGCHGDFQRLMPLAKHQLPQCPVGPRCVQLEGEECPLKVQHPPTGEEFSLGLSI
ncbi:hypothetical protein FO519_007385 [Halicephalobus sp. NKZ332]|nr:hypothetical protein FO519_007385 [Halicephalobus sp. NKZ332]